MKFLVQAIYREASRFFVPSFGVLQKFSYLCAMIEIKRVHINDDFIVLNHLFHGIDDLMKHVTMSLYKDWSRGPARSYTTPIPCSIRVGELWYPYPTFDSYDSMYENRSYKNFIIRDRKITQEDMKRLSDLPIDIDMKRITKNVPEDMLPMVYYSGDGDYMLVATVK